MLPQPIRLQHLRNALAELDTDNDQDQLMEYVLNAINNTLVITDPNKSDNPIVWVNRNFEALTGYSFDEAVGQNCRFLQGEDREQTGIKQLRSQLREGKDAHVELRNYRKDGSLFWNELYVSSISGKDAQPVLLLGVQNDITERKGLQDEHERIKNALLESAKQAVIVTNAQAPPTITYANPAFLKMTGYTSDEVIGQSLQMFQGERTSEVFLGRLRSALEQETSFQGETVNYRKDGAPYQVEWTMAPVTDADGAVTRWLSIQNDVTERRRLERELLQVSAREQAHLARDLHDSVQQNLLATKMFAGNLRKTYGAQPDLAQHFEQFEGFLNEALENLRAVSHSLAPSEFEHQGFLVAVERLIRTFDQLHPATFTFDYEVPLVIEDTEKAEHLYRIVQEALSNVVKHAQATSVRIQFSHNGEKHVLQVVDDGKGLPPSPDGAQAWQGMGLRSMRYRANIIGAELSLKENEQGGVTLECIFNGEPIPSY